MSIPYRSYTEVDGVQFLTFEEWILNGRRHRVDGPALREWEVLEGHAEPVLKSEEWYLNGQLHRADGPALQAWYLTNGESILIREMWYLNGRLSRLDGPAYRAWEVVGGHGHEQGLLTNEGWYLNGAEIDPVVLRKSVGAIERWWQYQQARRQEAIEEELWENGMTVFPGFMGLLREY